MVEVGGERHTADDVVLANGADPFIPPIRRGVGLDADRLEADAGDPRAPAGGDHAESNGFLALLSDGECLTGAYALGPEAGEWLQQATLAIRARVPLDVLVDTIQPFPTFSEIYLGAVKELASR